MIVPGAEKKGDGNKFKPQFVVRGSKRSEHVHAGPVLRHGFCRSNLIRQHIADIYVKTHGFIDQRTR